MPDLPRHDVDNASDLELIYKIEGEASEIDVEELAQVLSAFAAVLKEGYRVAHPASGELTVKVKPFVAGSFIMDLPLGVHDAGASALLYAAQHHQELIAAAKQTLEALGFIRKAGEKFTSFLELVRRLKNGKPEKIDQKGPDEYDFHAGDGAVIPVNSTINALYNNPIINKNTYNIILPATRESVTDILTYLKDDQANTRVRIGKEDVEAIRAYSKPAVTHAEPEVYEDTNIRVLHPKSGNYGQTTGTWSFKIAGQKGSIKAKIVDENFLARYASGDIRFHQKDRLKVKLHEKQIIEGPKVKMVYEILEVLEYVPSTAAPVGQEQ